MNAPLTHAPSGEPRFRIYDGFSLVAVLVLGGLACSMAAVRGYLPSGPATLVLLGAAGQVFTILVILWLSRRRGVSLRRLVLGRASWSVEVALGLAAALAFWSLAALLWLLRLAPISDSLSQTFEQTPLATRIGFLVVAVLLAPLGEELLFRGVLQTSLAARLGVLLACLIQAAVFGLMHQRGAVVIIVVFFGGLAYGGLALWRGCLLPGMAAHGAFNGIAAGWLIALVWINAHTPAQNLVGAAGPPAWRSAAPLPPIPNQATAHEQWEAAIWLYGSQGLQLRKTQIQAFERVRERFPEDEQYGAQSLLGIQEIYLRYLDDPYRAIVTGQQLMDEYPQQRVAVADARLSIVESYVRLGEFRQARTWLAQGDSRGVADDNNLSIRQRRRLQSLQRSVEKDERSGGR